MENFLHNDPLVWFDIEIKQFLMIDVYQSPFPHNKGYDIFENDIARVLLMRLENLNECATEAMGKFMGFKNFQLVNGNVSREKEYVAIYRKFLETANLPDSYIEKMYSTKFSKHFYTQEELESFRKKWMKAE